MPSILDKVYARAPVVLQNVMATGYGLRQLVDRHAGEYSSYCRQLADQQWWSSEALAELQNRRLRQTISFAYEQVPYYRELLDGLRLRPSDIRSSADLRQLPILEKDNVQAGPERFRPRRLASRVIASTTGGTTGRPMPYWVTPSAVQFNYAIYEVRFRHWAGVRFGERMVSINGKPIVPMDQQGPPYWRHNLAFNQLYVSAYHLTDDNLPAICDRIAAFRPRVIVAYVSAVHRIAHHLNESGRAGEIRPRAVLVSSETLWDWQRQDIERAFGCKVHNGYSLGEPVCFVSECADGGLHISPEYGVIELEPGPQGHEIIATGLVNDAMPFLRYRTGDYAVAHEGGGCRCGRGLPLIGRITGRVDEVLWTPERATVGPAALSLAFQSVPHLRESQILQASPEEITLRIATAPAFGPVEESILLAELRKRLGHTLRITIERVPQVPRTVGGKQRLIVSSLRGLA